ncbi:hypothetical protein H6P81_003191 [Aristolochia fimbriata]|uniref:Putative plant transposon protein domain-containing protein n=1 Tax=Aristolochia fimbriata TaxID=158543 RepID=A0AAV7FCN0_ARIFI|nr:hypothetical protein H6P81_003191 [Aristolochia fimbriata]
MAPKCKKGKEAWDRSVFSCEKAYEMYTKGILMMKPIPERGLDNRELDPPKGAIVPLVREFYANANVARRWECSVRGQTIVYDSCIINMVYQTPWEGLDDYYTLKDRVTPEEVGAFMCPNRTTWKMRNDNHISIPKKYLNKEAMVWLYFVCAKLITSLHYSTVTKDRAFLIYAIMKGKTIDIGKVISEGIVASAMDFKKGFYVKLGRGEMCPNGRDQLCSEPN